MDDPLLTLDEIAIELRCSKAHVSHLLNGKLPAIPRLLSIALGRRRLVRKSTLETWKKDCEAASAIIDSTNSINAVNA